MLVLGKIREIKIKLEIHAQISPYVITFYLNKSISVICDYGSTGGTI
jgi:hypothetical protein